jgi:hypothetical protein
MARDSAKNIPYGIHGMEGGIHPFHMESIWNIPGSVKTSMKYYIPGDGPNDTTPVDALNLWRAYFQSNSFLKLTLMSSLIEQIEKDFKFFPHLHKVFATHHNVTPIVVTTTHGPQGHKTVWFQPPDKAADSTAGFSLYPSSPSLSYVWYGCHPGNC